MPSKADLAKIHIAKKELGLTDEAYRDVLRNLFQKESAKDLSPRQAAQLLRHFGTLGWRPRQQKLPGPALAGDPMLRKIRALWLELAKAGVVRDASEQALLTFVKKQVKVDRLQGATTEQKSQIIEALKDWGKRKGGELG